MNKAQQAVKIAVVGHANTGKTSLIRTLLRDTDFGEVADYAGTTRHVEAAELAIDGTKLIELFDTPGLEDSVALKLFWDSFKQQAYSSNSERMAAFIEALDSQAEFAQEQKVLRQSFKSDVLLYVIDAREPYLGKYRDELLLLGATSRPIVPVLNFIAANQENKQRWREQLIDHGLHAVVEYDTVAFTMQAEQRLYEKLQTMDEPNYNTFQQVIDYNTAQYQARCLAGAKSIAEQYINIAAYRITVDAESVHTSTPEVQELVRQAEQKNINQLLSIFGFDKDDIRNEFLPVQDGKWELDLFDARTYKEFGLQAGSGAAKGAAVGAGIDLFVGGISMGVGAAIGAVAGVVWNSLQKYGGSIRNKFTGASYVCVDDTTVTLFYLRQRYLLQSLMARGHAAQDAVALGQNDSETSKLPPALEEVTHLIRSHHKWSNLDSTFSQYLGEVDKKREQSLQGLTEHILDN